MSRASWQNAKGIPSFGPCQRIPGRWNAFLKMTKKGNWVIDWSVPRQQCDWNPRASGEMCKVFHHLVIARSSRDKRLILESKCIEGDLTKYSIIWSFPVNAENAWSTLCQMVKYPVWPVYIAHCPTQGHPSVHLSCIFLYGQNLFVAAQMENKENWSPNALLIHLLTDWPWQRSWGTHFRKDGLLHGL